MSNGRPQEGQRWVERARQAVEGVRHVVRVSANERLGIRQGYARLWCLSIIRFLSLCTTQAATCEGASGAPTTLSDALITNKDIDTYNYDILL